MASQYADTAVKEFFFFTTTYGPPFDQKLSVVELPNDTVPSAWAPEIAALAGRHFTEKGELSAAGEYDCASVVRNHGEPGHEE